MNLSVIIVNWNTKDYLERCLRSVFEHTKGIELEVFVVDNASTDGSAQIVKEKFTQVKLIENKENLGFAKANNQALSQSHSEYLLLLNNDTAILPNSIKKMINFMEQHPKAGMVGPKLLNADGRFQRSCWKKFPSLLSVFINRFYLYKLPKVFPFVKSVEIFPEETNKPMKVAHLLGACILVRQEAIKTIGYLDEQFYMYLEETDWCYRVAKCGWGIYYLPSAEIIHYGQKSSKENISRMTEEGPRSYCKFFRKHYKGRIKLILLKNIIFIGTMFKLIKSLLYYIKYRNDREKAAILANTSVLRKIYSY